MTEGEGLPVSDDVERYTTPRMLMREREFRWLARCYPVSHVEAAVLRRLAPAARRSGQQPLLVYETEKLRAVLSEMQGDADAWRGVHRLFRDARRGPIRPAGQDEAVGEALEKIRKIAPVATVAAIDVLRRAGLTWKQIAERTGYSDVNSVQYAYRAATGKVIGEMREPEEVLEWAEQNLLEIHEQFRQTATYPGYLHDVQGRLLMDPDGNPEINEDARNRALLGQVKVIEAETRLRGVIAPARTQVTHDLAPLEARLLEAYDQLKRRALEEAAVDAEWTSGDDEAEDEGEQAGGQEPRRADADDATSGESG